MDKTDSVFSFFGKGRQGVKRSRNEEKSTKFCFQFDFEVVSKARKKKSVPSFCIVCRYRCRLLFWPPTEVKKWKCHKLLLIIVVVVVFFFFLSFCRNIPAIVYGHLKILKLSVLLSFCFLFFTLHSSFFSSFVP